MTQKDRIAELERRVGELERVKECGSKEADPDVCWDDALKVLKKLTKDPPQKEIVYIPYVPWNPYFWWTSSYRQTPTYDPYNPYTTWCESGGTSGGASSGTFVMDANTQVTLT